ncbi:zinc-finger domain-containing protein [Bacillus timonensis]|nr:zinc-finger domain-containing protein [Bacillus timonensis]
MGKNKLIMEVGEMLDKYCDGCFLNKHFRKELGKTHAQSFCIKNCSVGQKLKEYGEKLS